MWVASAFTVMLLPLAAHGDLVHRWTFDDLEDSAGGLSLTLQGGAQLENGCLILDGHGSYAVSAPLSKPLGTRTLIAWITLSDFRQRGAGIISLVNFDGTDVFDAITYGEMAPGAWENGSEYSSRTIGWSQTDPEASRGQLVIAVTYSGDGMICIFRNGRLLRSGPGKSGDLITYPGPSRTKSSSQAAFFFGIRHEDKAKRQPDPENSKSAFLEGTIHEVQVFDGVLTEQEILELSAQQK